MKTFKILICLLGLGMGTSVFAQDGEVINDTLYITPSANKPIEFSRAIGKVLYLRNVIPDDLNPKLRKIQIISSVANEISEKLITVVNNKDIVIAFELFTDRYYTLYIKKTNATIATKKLIIR